MDVIYLYSAVQFGIVHTDAITQHCSVVRLFTVVRLFVAVCSRRIVQYVGRWCFVRLGRVKCDPREAINARVFPFQ